ncbi:hypothetical protein ACFWB0_10825 [Rhodococcus sp. NPDC060086]|uniref:hypothetical protein n=1 Tax=Rhodococcus sp. NPDC060086 TaxID=3347055 RepID=UPI00365F7247
MATSASARPPGDPIESLTRPGTYVANDRYRLLERHIAAGNLQFWRGHDTVIDRDVALTVVPVPARWGDRRTRFFELLCIRTASAAYGHAGAAARVFDIVDADSFCLVVAEWTPGRSIVDAVGRRPAPAMIAAMTADLVEMVCTAHHLSAIPCLDDPGRIRVDVDGKAVMAFPATLPDWGKADDVVGLGALVRTLLGHDVGRIGEHALRLVADDAVSGRIATAAAFADRVAEELPPTGATTDSATLGALSDSAEAASDGGSSWSPGSDLAGPAPSPHRTSAGPRPVLTGAAVFLLFLGSFVGLGWTAGNALWDVDSGLMATVSLPSLPSSDDRTGAAAPPSRSTFRPPGPILVVGSGLGVGPWERGGIQVFAVEDVVDRSQQLAGHLVRLQSAVPAAVALPLRSDDGVDAEVHGMDRRAVSDLDIVRPRVQPGVSSSGW